MGRTSRLTYLTLALPALLGGCDKLNSVLQSSEVSGTIDKDTTWPLSMCPITVVDDVYVEGPTAPTLTIEAGCQIQVRAGKGIWVAYHGQPGALMAMGTADKPILFTSEAINRTPGAWAGISLHDHTVSGSTHFTYVTVEYAGGPYVDGALDVDGANPLVDHSTFRASAKNGVIFRSGGGFAQGSAAVSATGNALYGIVVPAETTDTVPEDGDYSGNSAGAVQIAGGTVAVSATWGDIKQPYVVSEDVYVEGAADPALTLAAGVVLAFDADKGLWIAYHGQPGALAIEGTAAAHVKLGSHGAQQPGAWAGVSFHENADDTKSSLSYADIEYAGGAFLDGCIAAEGAKPTLKAVHVTHCDGDGIQLRSGAALGAGSTAIVSTNNSNAGISAEASAVATLPSEGSDYSMNDLGGVQITGGTVAQSGAWHAQNAPYIVSDDIYVEGNAAPTLTLEAGAELRFQSGKGVWIAYHGQPGALAAQGTAMSPVTFTSYLQQEKGSWAGLSFHEEAADGPSVLDHVVVEWAGEGLGGAIDTENARPTIRNSKIWRSSSCGIHTSCTDMGQGPAISNIDYGSGADANDGGDLCNDGC